MTSRRRIGKAAATAASVSLATGGMSTCHDNGAVDPPPPPLECNQIDAGQSLEASARIQGPEVEVTIVQRGVGSWLEAAAVDAGNAAIQRTTIGEDGRTVLVALSLIDPGTGRAAFALSGRLVDGFRGATCEVTRRFEVVVDGGAVQVQQAARLPLGARQNASIAVVSRRGRVVELEARTAFAGRAAAEWRVSGGTSQRLGGARVRWELPAEPGVYQIELVMDYGEEGVAFDALALEVGGSEPQEA